MTSQSYLCDKQSKITDSTKNIKFGLRFDSFTDNQIWILCENFHPNFLKIPCVGRTTDALLPYFTVKYEDKQKLDNFVIFSRASDNVRSVFPRIWISNNN
uniref:Uncharacterized protein n=1 Tax=Ciona intestinalis TaxID=7719 RepID=H2XQ99_CIOIN